MQALGMSCRCGPSQAARLLISQSAGLGQSSSFGLGLLGHARGATLGLSHKSLGSAVWLWVGQLASAPGAHPPEVSGVGPQSANLGAHNWA